MHLMPPPTPLPLQEYYFPATHPPYWVTRTILRWEDSLSPPAEAAHRLDPPLPKLLPPPDEQGNLMLVQAPLVPTQTLYQKVWGLTSAWRLRPLGEMHHSDLHHV